MRDKRIIIAGIFMIFLAGFVCQVSGYAVGASPATLSFTVPRGGYEEKTFQVSTNSETPMLYSIAVSSSIEELIKIKPKEGETIKGKPAEIIVRASAARSAKPGNYSGMITVTLKPNLVTSEGSGSVVATGVVIRANIIITEDTEHPLKNIPLSLITIIAVVLIVLASLYFKKYYFTSEK